MKIEYPVTHGWEAAIRGMRNPLNSWNKSDTYFNTVSSVPKIGPNDLKLMQKLCRAGGEHRKFMRYINVTFDLTAPLVFWQQMDTYKVGTVRNSCSKMHKLLYKPFTKEDFACESLNPEAMDVLTALVVQMNDWRERYLKTPIEDYETRNALWDAILRLLPESYCQKATMQMNYEVLRNIYRQRKGHKLPEWTVFIKWIETLPYAKELLIDEEGKETQ